VSDIPPILHQVLAGRYVLKREIGRGGAATVYLAHDVRHERLVAIKVLHPELSHALGAKRFLREIKLTASLQHPHILPIHDSGEAEDQLFYVMPYVEGDSLRQRLGADNRLSIEEAVRVGREVAGALAYAHERGVVHRDIKPENILFSGGHAVLADFGIARAIDRASDKITQQGMITGTPAYMSPEQARDRAFDGRSDVYSLACVLYEAIAGVPPFVGDTPQQLLSQRIAKTPPLLREYRHDVPVPIESVIARALAISPDDRFDDARAFSAALSAAIGNSGETTAPRPMRRPLTQNPWLWAAGVTLLVAGGAATTPMARDEIEVLTRRIDTAQYAVVPFQYVGAAAPANDAEPTAAGVYDALRRWDGLHLASEIGVSDAVRRQGPAPLTLDDVFRVARSVRAGRAVWGRVRVAGDSLVVRAGVYDALTGENLREVTRVVRAAGGGAAGAVAIHELDFRSLTTDLLRASRGVRMSEGADRGTATFRAWQAFDRGAAALARWDVAEAQRELEAAVAADPSYPHANLWLAQLKLWHDVPAREWTTPYMAADHGRALLDPRERAMVDALGAISRDDHPAACRAYETLRRRDSLDAVAWLGLAFCHARDKGVVPSRATATGLAFRGSTEASWRAITRALELEPQAFAVMPYGWLRNVLIVEHNLVRHVQSPAGEYTGVPTLVGDTIAYTPYPQARFGSAVWPEGYDAALRLNRDRMLTLLELLTRRLPENPDAFEALTRLLETRDEIIGTPNGRFSALTALERARALATSPEQRIRLAIADVRLHLKLGDFARSSATADSVLRAQSAPTPAQAEQLAALAAYTGHAGQAAAYQGMSGIQPYRGGAPSLPAAENALLSLQMRAALGICDDSVRALIASVEQTLVSYVGPAERPMLHDRLLERPIMLAAPCSGARTSLLIGAPATKLVRAQQRAARGDMAGARVMMDSLNATRHNMRPGALSLDNLVQEAWLQDFSGDPKGAAIRLDVTLNALPTLSTAILAEPVMAAAVGRSMAYRAELAVRLEDSATAALWAGRVLTLWGHADANMEPTVARMRRLAGHRLIP
jgi:tRNA A-37 threonylcarbamoyl transferase component Bud32